MHWEFRYTLSMHYFLFVFAAVSWVVLGGATLRGLRHLIRKAQIRGESNAQK
jgi:hypothetical protein